MCNNILDLIFSTEKIDVQKADEEFSKIDKYHPPLHLMCTLVDNSDVSIPNEYLNETQETYNFHKANYEEINKKLESVYWEDELCHLNTESATNVSYNIIMS